MKSFVKALIILPGTVLVIIPTGLLWLSHTYLNKNQLISKYWYLIALSIAFLIFGLLLAITAIKLFLTVGQGTPAPWDPPKKMVIAGPYKYVRNPMISGVLLLLMTEALFFSSWLIFGWLLIFFIANSIYFPLVEEKGLLKRFGVEYTDYKNNVPRWIPRFTPYQKP